MSITVKAYYFEKSINSTELPVSASNFEQFECMLKDETSMYRPTIRVNCPTGLSATRIRNANYWELDNVPGRYFFKEGMTYITATIVDVSLVLDVVGSYYDPLAPCFVKYSSYRYDSMIPDDRIAIPNTVLMKQSKKQLNGMLTETENLTSGTYIVGWAGSASVTGGCQYIALSHTEASTLFNRIYNPDFFQKLKDETMSIDDLLVSCMWLPVHPTEFPLPASISAFGELITSGRFASGYLENLTTNVQIEIPYSSTHVKDIEGTRTEVTNYSHYVNFDPYTQYKIWLPGVGEVELNVLALVENPREIQQFVSFNIKYIISVTDGVITYYIQKATGYPADEPQVFKGTIGTQLSIPKHETATISGIASSLGAIGSASMAFLAKNPAQKAMGMLATVAGAGNAIRSFASQQSTAVGSAGSFSNDMLHNGNVICKTLYPEVSESILNFEYVKAMGGPVFRYSDNLEFYRDTATTDLEYISITNYFPAIKYGQCKEAFAEFLDIMNSARSYSLDGVLLGIRN